MEQNKKNISGTKLQMKNWVIVKPRKSKELIIFLLMIGTILVTILPIMNLWNHPVLIFGIPALMLIALFSLVSVLVVINLAYKWEVF